jgi:hypothetical protein
MNYTKKEQAIKQLELEHKTLEENQEWQKVLKELELETIK